MEYKAQEFKLYSMPNIIQDGGAKKSPYQFFHRNFYKHRHYPSKPSDFQFQFFCHTGLNFQGHTQCQSQIVGSEPRAPLKKIWFFRLNCYKVEVMITPLKEMLQLSNFGHMTTSAMSLESRNETLLVTSWTELMMSYLNLKKAQSSQFCRHQTIQKLSLKRQKKVYMIINYALKCSLYLYTIIAFL